MDLLLAPFGAGVILVQAGEVAIITLIERHALQRLEITLPHGIQHKAAGPLRPAEARSEGGVEMQPLGLQLFASALGFHHTLFGQVRVTPAGEQVLEVPLALAMAHEHENAFGHL